MNELIKYGAFGIGAWVLYNAIKNSSFMQPAMQIVNPISSNVNPNAPTAAITTPSASVRSEMMNTYVGSTGQELTTYLNWANLYHQATGKWAPAYPDSIMGQNGFNPGTPISVDQFITTARVGNGISGIGFLTRPNYFERNLVRQ